MVFGVEIFAQRVEHHQLGSGNEQPREFDQFLLERPQVVGQAREEPFRVGAERGERLPRRFRDLAERRRAMVRGRERYVLPRIEVGDQGDRAREHSDPAPQAGARSRVEARDVLAEQFELLVLPAARVEHRVDEARLRLAVRQAEAMHRGGGHGDGRFIAPVALERVAERERRRPGRGLHHTFAVITP